MTIEQIKKIEQEAEERFPDGENAALMKREVYIETAIKYMIRATEDKNAFLLNMIALKGGISLAIGEIEQKPGNRNIRRLLEALLRIP